MFLPSQQRELPAFFMALANPTRLRVLERLGEVGEESVSELAQHLRMSQPRVSWHLRMLRLGGAVRQRRDGRQIYFSLDEENIQLRQRELLELLGLSAHEVKG
jgi:ArsR family transcriptional regulator, arsenate/arsenite/antimonite-responsive transcriptional repressor